MKHDEAYHWPPELLELLIDTVPRLSKSKEGVLTFLRSAGVSEDLLHGYRELLRADRTAVSKFTMVRDVLGRLNEQGDTALPVRRQLLHHVTEFQEFTTLWEEDRSAAKGNIADIRSIVNTRDAFTRMQQEREAERDERVAAQRAQQEEINRRRQRLQDLKDQLAQLFSLTNPQARGIALENVLNSVFDADGILIRDSFTLRNEEGVAGEQIDGVIEVDGAPYLVEVKWWNKPIDVDPISRHLVRVFTRAEARGLFISASGYTRPAVQECANALNHRVIVLGELKELVILLERQGSVTDWVRQKTRSATVDRRPLVLFAEDF
ncbi:restriction endonuclease [Streptomyces sp. NPDC059340]|uniref:restriction endonuclease n=1 Tax=Streptomyces sp. NPDC059340 TaxID=3346806 RepID=UPI0036B04747